MTMDEFIEKLKERAPLFTWSIDQFNRIRGDRGESAKRVHVDRRCCPISSLDDSYFADQGTVWLVGEQNGLTPRQVERIIKAADGKPKLDRHLRRRLLEAVGLSIGRAR